MKKKQYTLAWLCLLTLTTSVIACDEDSVDESGESIVCGTPDDEFDLVPLDPGPGGEPSGPDAVPLPGETIVELSVTVVPDEEAGGNEVDAMIEFETADGRAGTIHYVQGEHTTVEISDREGLLVAVDTSIEAVLGGADPSVTIPDEQAFADSLEFGVLAVAPYVIEIALEDEAMAAITWHQQPQADCADSCGLTGQAVSGIGGAAGATACGLGLGPTPAAVGCAAGAAALWMGMGWLTAQGCQAVAC